RTFDREHETRPYLLLGDLGSDPVPVVADRAFAEALGFRTPAAAVDQIVWFPKKLSDMLGKPRVAARIIGVVETDRMRMGVSVIAGGHWYIYAPGSTIMGEAQIPSVKIAKESLPATLKAIEAAWSKLSPDVPLNVRFFDQLFERSYREYARISQVFIGLAMA